MEIALDSDGSNQDIYNQQFWDQLSEMLEVAAKMLYDTIKELDFDPDELPEHNEPSPDPVDEKAVKIAQDYTMAMTDWLRDNREVVMNKHETLLNIGSSDAQLLADTFEVIQYYFMMIFTKTYRSYLSNPLDDDNSDAQGSAKIALIMINRSIASWTKLMEFLPIFEDDALNFLKKLAIIKKLIQEKHPDAMDFKRPGFD
jgi:hypothetical protein